ncbi:MAG: hypothetical protein O7G13_07260 [Alphaproteobacteria bacterium]|nr:hypothetical protein [Alphaproteobacteria bacterium]
MPKKTENSLYLYGDGDDVEILEGVEATFDVKISDDEAPSLYTLGDLYDLLVSKLNASDSRRSICLTAASFYRLRRALTELTGVKDISPRTQLDSIFPNGKIGQAAKQIEHHTKMRLPIPELGKLATTLVMMLFFGTPILAIAIGQVIGHWGWSVLLLWALVVPLLKFAAYRAPEYCSDVGSLAKTMAGLNYSLLSAEFGVSHQDDVWNALVEVLKNQALTSGPINQETTFFSSVQ